MADTIATAVRAIDDMRRELEDLQHMAVGDVAAANEELFHENNRLRAEVRRLS